MKRAHYRFVPCYFNPDTYELEGRNKFYDHVLSVVIWFDVNVLGVEGFKIKVEE